MSSECLPATLDALLRDLVGEFVHLTLIYAVADLPGASFPVGRIVFVGTDYLALSHVLVNRRPLDVPVLFITLGQVQEVNRVRPDQIVLEVGLALEGGQPPC